MKPTREDFETDGQFNKWLKLEVFFKELIKLSNQGVIFADDHDSFGKPYINGAEMGFKEGGCRVVFVGNCETEDGKVWVDTSVTKIKKKLKAYKRVKLDFKGE